jgi:integrase
MRGFAATVVIFTLQRNLGGIGDAHLRQLPLAFKGEILGAIEETRMTRHSPTVRDFAERFLTEYAGPPWHAVKNVGHVRSVLNNYLLPDLGDLHMHEVEPRHLRGVQRRLFARHLKLNTVKGALQSVWGGIWKAALSEGLVSGKPHSELSWPKSEPSPDPFEPGERDQIIAWFRRRQPQYVPLVGSVFLAGMRPSEACGLRWGDIDLDTGEVTIARAIASREQTKMKTRKSPRVIRVSDELRKLYDWSKPAGAEGSALCCRTRHRNPVDSQQFGRVSFKTCCEELGLRYRGFYAGRHTFISIALMNEGNPAELSVFCAVSLGTMQRHYWRWMGAVNDPVEAARKRAVARAVAEKPRSSAHAAGA